MAAGRANLESDEATSSQTFENAIVKNTSLEFV
jgi:hypothetical protein